MGKNPKERAVILPFGRIDMGGASSEDLTSESLVQKNVETPIETTIDVGKSRVEELSLDEERIVLEVIRFLELANRKRLYFMEFSFSAVRFL